MNQIIPALLLFQVLVVSTLNPDYGAMLISYLTNNITDFSPRLYPRIDTSKSLTISLDAMLGHIALVDTAKQSVKVSAFMLAQWEEERLVWNPADFGGIDSTQMGPTQIWYPTIVVYNGIGDYLTIAVQNAVTLLSITSNLSLVTITWLREYEFFCDFRMHMFPFDRHTCNMVLLIAEQNLRGSVQPKKNRNIPYETTGVYDKNSEWILLNASSFVEVKSFKMFNNRDPYIMPVFVLSMEIQRESAYYLTNVIAPLLLLTLLQAVAALVPMECGERLGFGITIMLSYTVFLLLLDGIVPKTQDMPAIAKFITAAMILSTVSLLLTSLIMRFNSTPRDTRMSACTRAVFVCFLGRTACISTGAQVEQKPTSEKSVRKANSAMESDWVIATCAMERLMAVLSPVAVALIVAVYIVAPYAFRLSA